MKPVDIWPKKWKFADLNVTKILPKMKNLLVDKCAGVAQLVEQRFCKPQVAGSNPFSSSILSSNQLVTLMGVSWRDTQVAKGIRL